MLELKEHTDYKEREDRIFPLFYIALWKVIFIGIVSIVTCDVSQAATYKITDNIAGEVLNYTVGEEDTLYSLARKFDVGIIDLMAANPGVDAWVPGVGSVLSIPTSYILPDVKRSGIVINLSELRLYYFPDAKTVMTFPVGIGREGWQTPIGETTIILKRKNPTWTTPASILAIKPDLPKVTPAGPDNPLGQYAMNLGWPSYLIHGTNKPYGIGLRSSHGCIRMYPEDIEVLFKVVAKGTKVTVIDNPYKLQWSGGALYIEVSPTEAQTDNLINNENPDPVTPAEVYKKIEKMTINKVDIDWKLVDEALIKRTGIPVDITMHKEIQAEENKEQAPAGQPTE